MSSEETSTVVPMVSRASRLADALGRARQREQARLQEQRDVREGRVAALAQELEAMAADLPDSEGGHFELVAAHTGDRLIIDPLSYVDLEPNTLDYRLIRQRRDGPETVFQHSDRDDMANGLADYIAERIVEREGLSSVSASTSMPTDAQTAPAAVQALTPQAPAPIVKKGLGFWGGFWLFLLGGLCSATALFTYAWLSQAPNP